MFYLCRKYNEEMAKIPLEILMLEDNSYHLLIDVILNKEIYGKVIVDTGASKTILDSCLELDKAEVEIGDKSYSSGLGGKLDIGFVSVKKMQIGSFKIKKMIIPTVDLSEVNKVYEKATHHRIIGLLGSDLLLRYQAKIDYRKKYLKLR